MPIPARYLSSFSPSTLKTIETHAAQFRVSESLFFRGAYTANVTENERRKFAPVIVFAAARVLSSRCTCTATMKPNDLCRHLAVLVDRMVGADSALPSERFEQSVWRAIAFASFSEGREIRAEDGDPREQMLRRYVLTEQEQALLHRGSGSARLLFEASPWYRWSKEMFQRGAEDTRIELIDGSIALVLADLVGEVALKSGVTDNRQPTTDNRFTAKTPPPTTPPSFARSRSRVDECVRLRRRRRA